MTSAQWRTWTVDVEALGRAVDVPVDGDRAPSARDVLDARDSEDERRVVAAAHRKWVADLRAGQLEPIAGPPEHDCHFGACACCPGCGDGCGHCEPTVLCWDGEVGCVMPAGHGGNCVPGGSPWKTHADVDRVAERLRVAGIEHALVRHERNPDRWRLERTVDRRVPDSGRWVRRWTPRNTEDTKLWIATGAREEIFFEVRGDAKGPLLLTGRAATGQLVLEVGVGDVLRLEGGRFTVHDGGWANSGRPLPDPALRMDNSDWVFLR